MLKLFNDKQYEYVVKVFDKYCEMISGQAFLTIERGPGSKFLRSKTQLLTFGVIRIVTAALLCLVK